MKIKLYDSNRTLKIDIKALKYSRKPIIIILHYGLLGLQSSIRNALILLANFIFELLKSHFEIQNHFKQISQHTLLFSQWAEFGAGRRSKKGEKN